MKMGSRTDMVLSTAALGFSVFVYVYNGGNLSSASKSEEMLFHVPAHNMSTIANEQNPEQDGQDQNPSPGQGGQPGDTPTHRYSPGDRCSSVNPNAPDKERNGVNPNTVGCACVRKCVNGQTQEDLSKDEKGVYICKNACHKDRCSCPDPCKS